jgi:hypothetical protein
MSMEAARAAVAKGAALLDEHDPGWWEVIDVDTLELARCDVCVLGQWASANFLEDETFPDGAYNVGLEQLEVEFSQRLYGFNAEGLSASGEGTTYRQLDEAWTEAILWREHLDSIGELA